MRSIPINVSPYVSFQLYILYIPHSFLAIALVQKESEVKLDKVLIVQHSKRKRVASVPVVISKREITAYGYVKTIAIKNQLSTPVANAIHCLHHKKIRGVKIQNLIMASSFKTDIMNQNTTIARKGFSNKFLGFSTNSHRSMKCTLQYICKVGHLKAIPLNSSPFSFRRLIYIKLSPPHFVDHQSHFHIFSLSLEDILSYPPPPGS